MNAEQLDVARRLAAHPRFKLRAGMILLNDDADPAHVLSVEGDEVWFAQSGRVLACKASEAISEGDYPDLTDDATGGVLIGMLGDGWLVVSAHGWGVHKPGRPVNPPRHHGTTLAEACARALLAEWGEP